MGQLPAAEAPIAVAQCISVLRSLREARTFDQDLTSSFAVAEEVASAPVEWRWNERIPRGKLVLLDGDPGSGKTTLALEIASCLSTGRLLPLETEARRPEHSVILSYEDGLSDTLRPRLEAAEADLSRVHLLKRGPGTP